MAIEVGEGFGVIGDHGIEVECLRIGEVGVGHGYRDVGPVGGEPASDAVARSKVRIANWPTKRLRNIAIYGFDLLEAESQTISSFALTSTSVGSCSNTEGFS